MILFGAFLRIAHLPCHHRLPRLQWRASINCDMDRVNHSHSCKRIAFYFYQKTILSLRLFTSPWRTFSHTGTYPFSNTALTILVERLTRHLHASTRPFNLFDPSRVFAHGIELFAFPSRQPVFLWFLSHGFPFFSATCWLLLHPLLAQACFRLETSAFAFSFLPFLHFFLP